MQTLRQLFDNTPYLNLIFLLLAVLGLILSIYFYYKSKREKLPLFSKKTISLINKNLASLNDLEINYKNHKVDTLSLTKIAFWNSGKEPIRLEDFTNNDPLLIKAQEPIIIYDTLISYSNKTNNCRIIKKENNNLEFKFDFLNFNDGLVIDVYHNGNKSTDIHISGTIIGARKITEGVKKDYFMNKFFILFRPSEFLINKSKNKVLNFIGFLFGALLIFIIIFPIFFIFGPIDFLIANVFRKVPKEFNIYDK